MRALLRLLIDCDFSEHAFEMAKEHLLSNLDIHADQHKQIRQLDYTGIKLLVSYKALTHALQVLKKVDPKKTVQLFASDFMEFDEWVMSFHKVWIYTPGA